jgi:hypothetical protein
MKAYRWSKFIAPLIPELDESEWLTSSSGCFTPGIKHRYLFNKKQRGTQSRSGLFGKEKVYFFLAGFEAQTFQPVA